jgi:hypothetical protein
MPILRTLVSPIGAIHLVAEPSAAKAHLYGLAFFYGAAGYPCFSRNRKKSPMVMYSLRVSLIAVAYPRASCPLPMAYPRASSPPGDAGTKEEEFHADLFECLRGFGPVL